MKLAHCLRILSTKGSWYKTAFVQQLRIAAGITLVFERILFLLLLDAEQIQRHYDSLNCADGILSQLI